MLARTVVLFIALLNQLLMAFGYSVLPIAEEELGALVTALFTTISALWVWWKDQRWIP